MYVCTYVNYPPKPIPQITIIKWLTRKTIPQITIDGLYKQSPNSRLILGLPH